MQVLIVEPDIDLLDVMTYSLGRAGHRIVGAGDGLQALERLEAEPPDMVLLELQLPQLNGFEVCRRIRDFSTVPIIVVSAGTQERDIIRAFELGVDDYVTKPFSLKQLAARMTAIRHRYGADLRQRDANEVRAGDLVLNLQTHEASRGDVTVRLTPLEFRILYLLAVNEGQTIPYSRLVDYTWGCEGGDVHLLKTHICHIREKLNFAREGDCAIRSLPTVGYSLMNRSSAASESEKQSPVILRERLKTRDDSHDQSSRLDRTRRRLAQA